MKVKTENHFGSGIVLSILIIFMILFITPAAYAKGYASDPPFKVKIDFNRWHDIPELHHDMKRLENAFPKYLKIVSIGKSKNGLDLLGMIINNPDTGAEMSKAAMYIDANVHGNEIQGGEVCLYTIWYLMEYYSRIEKVKRIVDERVFYIFPCVNPDGRQYFMEGSGKGARTGHVPVDDDNDGLYDEDGPDDLNENGVIEQIIKHVPDKGTHIKTMADPRILEAVPFGKTGDYIVLGEEGIDDDDDGRVNEDGLGRYDMNRNWGSDWQPKYLQHGAMEYPFQLPESRAVNDFLLSHPNIAGVQAYHNSGGLICRGPGSQYAEKYPIPDVRVYDEIAENGERIIPFYRYIVLWREMYTVHGGFTDWTNNGLGIISFLNELWSGRQYFNSPELQKQTEDPNSPISRKKSAYFFDDYLEFGDQFIPWKEFNHPQYGKVEMGGRWKKTRGRLPPRFMNEELCHRNMAFTLYHADQMPLMQISEPEIKEFSKSIHRIRIDFTNPKVIATITAKAALNNVVRPDLLFIEGNVGIISASWINKKTFDYLKPVTRLIDQNDLKRIIIRNGHPGKTTRTMQYIVKGSGEVTVTYDSVKGGKVSESFTLK